MNDAEMVFSLETALRYHESQAERYRRMLAIAKDDGLAAPSTPKAGKKAKAAKEGEKSPRKQGASRAAVAAYFAKHPKATAKDVAGACSMTAAAAAYHLAALRRAS